MDIIKRISGDKTTYTFVGKLCTLNDYQKIRSLFGNIPKETKEITIDMSRLTFTSSHGLGSLVSAYQTVKKQGIKMSIENPRKEILGVMTIIGIDKIIPIKSQT